MPTRPTVVPVELVTAETPSTPTAGQQEVGATGGNAADPNLADYWMKYGSQWARYFAEMSPVSNEIGADSFALVIRGDGISLVGGDSTPSGNTTLIMGEGSIAMAQPTPLGNVFAFDEDYGMRSWFGMVVTGDSIDDGFRFGYSSTGASAATELELTWNAAASSGPWGLVFASYATVGSPHLVLKAKAEGGIYVVNGTASPATIEAERDLFPEAKHNAEAAADGGVVYTLDDLAVEMQKGLATDILIQLVRRTQGSGTESVLATLPSSGTPSTAATFTSYTNTGLGIALDLNTYTYTLRVVTTGVPASNTGGIFRDLIVTVEKGAVE